MKVIWLDKLSYHMGFVMESLDFFVFS